MRLDKYLCQTAGLSRSEARTAIQKGTVLLNGTLCKKADTQLTPTSVVQWQGQLLQAQPRFVYIMLHKPSGVVCATKDNTDPTVVDLLQNAFPKRALFPAGRLDKTSTGFVLLTDDGAFAHKLLSPKSHVEKRYAVLLDTPVTPAMVAAFAAGVRLASGEQMLPAGLHPHPQNPSAATVVLRQGVYHQIKRMFGTLGAGVDALHRFAIGGLPLDETLAAGQWRLLSPQEVARLLP